MEIEITSRKTIKPSSPRPDHLRTFNLAICDQLMPPFYLFTVFFYSSTEANQSTDPFFTFSQKSQFLQETLSDILVHYYPLAGRLTNASTINCNDEGAYFVEALFNCKLPELLTQPDAANLFNYLNPTIDPLLASSGCTLAVQLTSFTCGGMAISVCPSHKIADGSSLSTLVQNWSAIAREDGKFIAPKFLEPSFQPPQELLDVPFSGQFSKESISTRRILFDASAISRLKAFINKNSTGQEPHLTNVDLVVALIMRSAIRASRSLSGSSGSSGMYHLVNLRKRLVPPLPETAVGNIFWTIPVVSESEDQVDLMGFACKIRESLNQLYNGEFGKLKEKGERLKDTVGVDAYVCTSLCRFPYYEADFGWGKPLWVTSPSCLKNLIVLSDTKEGDGIETWVTLDEKEMFSFQVDNELLAFASSNPSVFS